MKNQNVSLKRCSLTPRQRLLPAIGLLVAMFIFNSCGPTSRLLEPEPNWVFLAQAKANHIRERDVFKIDSRDKFSAVKLYVYHRDLSIRRIEITLINGDVLRPLMDSYLRAGERSRTVELAADGRQIEKISVWYKSKGRLFSDKALVQIAGRRAADELR